MAVAETYNESYSKEPFMYKDYLYPGIAAIVVAVLYPAYWLLELDITFGTGVRRMEFGTLDFMFLTLGLLQAYLYLSLRRLLNDQVAYSGGDVLLMIIAVTTLVYSGFMFCVSFIDPLNTDAVVLGGTAAALVFFGVLDIVLAVILLRDSNQLPGLVKGVAVVNLILGACEVTLLMSFMTLVLYPLFAVLLAILFLRKPEEVEFV